jgi:hypothetical protein
VTELSVEHMGGTSMLSLNSHKTRNFIVSQIMQTLINCLSVHINSTTIALIS